ncbi:IDEAL domain-containing protein [Litchfieldia alkalitelluris]|uniref:IDEAL domain-containing protein n=1 Tax=Litchfieldia alkalitelluris TaxID=304268 RepID=UPI001474C3F5|nr:IDEAL domain-containing protein [Litchfieldia alkalitelluris]
MTNDRKYTIYQEWYFLIVINEQWTFYIAVEDLNQYYREEQILSILDIELKINHIQYQINEALDRNNKEKFLSYSTKLNEFKQLKMGHDKYINRLESVNFL